MNYVCRLKNCGIEEREIKWKLIKVNDLNFHEHTKSIDQLIIAFGANWCGKCKLLRPNFKKLARELPSHIGVFETFVEDSPVPCEKLEIENVHTTIYIYLDKGEIVNRTINIEYKAISDLVDE